MICLYHPDANQVNGRNLISYIQVVCDVCINVICRNELVLIYIYLLMPFELVLSGESEIREEVSN